MRSDEEVALRLEGVSKRYYLNPKRPWRIKDLVTRPQALLQQLRPRETFWALRDITLNVKKGEILGVIGRNGSGKSTLLRVLVGISPPTEGQVSIHGRYAALLDLGAGFHPHATGRENAYLNALFMGLSKSEAKAKVPEILEFSGLEEFADLPTRTYSSGMTMRLGFSVAVHVKPEILLIDEVLVVGDEDFQQKCLAHFQELVKRGTTIVLVTHDLRMMLEVADRAIRLEKGVMVQEGEPEMVVRDYVTHRIKTEPDIVDNFKRIEAKGSYYGTRST